ncbi:restriction endonuclease subunit S [Citrobacter freundii]|uniref:Restriction endonuclease subunit S n=2 Tax=Citrobacter freundii TaxID=546 RepID=A0AAI9HLB8_CITFR|nr:MULTISPECIES: restriction endonuclease subunit S [Enterobacteriaceae]EKV4360635.1 restriction endonuclease subunit S [Citrobacter freundii]EKV7202238.1 restriction endonuclease subunit S [Citrobacter freundii]EKX8776849.1 restriction endonuclease subunit S [Citrobacter freundii]ELE2064987.1 restriction endonuclease subunit S [Citrobacter freundii]ELF4152938.1 restriction endonuclease subunit S [Citrobacter freundii]
MVPKGWKRVPIKDVCESIIDCVNKTAPVVDYETPFKMIRTTNVRNGRVNTEDVRYVTEDTYLQWVRRGKPQVGDIIFTREAPVGEAGVLQDAEGIFLGQRTMMYRADTCLSDNYFLFYSLSSPFCQKQIEDFSNGGTVAHMRVPDCGEILINLPPFLEQKKIAQILSTWDKAISVTEKLLTNSQQQKKALMQQLLTGKKRLLDESGVRFNGKWEKKLLSDVADVYQPKTISQSMMSDSGYPVYGANGVIGFYQEFNHETEQIAVTCRGSTCGIVNWTQAKSWITGNAMVINTDNYSYVSKKFLFYTLNGSDLKYLISGSGQPQITGNIKTHIINLPCIEEQQKIATVLSAADAEIYTLEKKLACLRDEKKALMQQLLTGKRRVKVDEAVAE